MENKQMKCVKGKTCLYCGSNYCQYVDEVNKLKKENETLKVTREKLLLDKDVVEKSLKTVIAENEELKEQLQKYRSTFEEIREDIEQDTTCESRECGCDDYAVCLNCIKETILNKISEVENG